MSWHNELTEANNHLGIQTMNKYIMQGRHIEGTTYKYHLVSDTLVVERKAIKMTVDQAVDYAKTNNLQNVSSGLVAMMKAGVK